MTIGLGATLPDIELVDHEGHPWRTGDQRGRPLVLSLHRHLACLPCQEHIRQMAERLDEFTDAQIVVVSFAPVERVRAHRDHLGVPFTFVSDPDRQLYQALGAIRGSVRQIWNVGTLRMYGRLLRKGRRIRRPTEDIYQLGADVVVGRDGRIRFLSLPPSPDTRPSVDEVLAALDRDLG
ncbi:MAG: redoxin domain-containing protein [Acidimicrobiia bacterium]